MNPLHKTPTIPLRLYIYEPLLLWRWKIFINYIYNFLFTVAEFIQNWPTTWKYIELQCWVYSSIPKLKCWHLTFLHPWNCKLSCACHADNIDMYNTSEIRTRVCNLDKRFTSVATHLHYMYMNWLSFFLSSSHYFVQEIKAIYCTDCCIIFLKQFSDQWDHSNGLQIQTIMN